MSGYKHLHFGGNGLLVLTHILNHQRIPHRVSSNGTLYVIFRDVRLEKTEKSTNRTLVSMGIFLVHSTKVQSI